MSRKYLIDEHLLRDIRQDLAALKNATGLNTGAGGLSVPGRSQVIPEPIFLPAPAPILARITASNAAAHSWVEVDRATYEDVVDGRTGTENAYAPQGWEGIAPDTLVWLSAAVDRSGETPVTIYNIIDLHRGIRSADDAAPVDLQASGQSEDSGEFDVESSDHTAVVPLMTRFNVVSGVARWFGRVCKLTSNGNVEELGSEVKYELSAAAPDSPLDGHIAIDASTDAAASIKLNQPQDQATEVTINFVAATDDDTSDAIDITGDPLVLSFDDSGRLRGAPAGGAFTIAYTPPPDPPVSTCDDVYACLQALLGYDAGKTQVLGHGEVPESSPGAGDGVADALQWYDYEECSTSGGS